jgi:polysaccharide biosynthesis transport protein
MHATRWAEDDVPTQTTVAAEDDPGEESDAIEAYLVMLEIQPVQRTQLVNIAFDSPSSGLSARLANAHAQAYIRRGVELRTRAKRRRKASLRTSSWS